MEIGFFAFHQDGVIFIHGILDKLQRISFVTR